MIDSEEMAEILLGLEYAAILKMFAVYLELQEALEKGIVLFMDELNAFPPC